MSIVLPNGRLPWWKRFGVSVRNLFFWRDSRGNKYPPLTWSFWGILFFTLAFISVNVILWTKILPLQFEKGKTDGFNSGYQAGYAAGRTPFYNEGHSAGWSAGYQKGKTDGEEQGRQDILSKLATVRIGTGTKGTILLELFGTPSSITVDTRGILWDYDGVVFKMEHTYHNDVPSVVSFTGNPEELKQKQQKKANLPSTAQ